MVFIMKSKKKRKENDHNLGKILFKTFSVKTLIIPECLKSIQI